MNRRSPVTYIVLADRVEQVPMLAGIHGQLGRQVRIFTFSPIVGQALDTRKVPHTRIWEWLPPDRFCHLRQQAGFLTMDFCNELPVIPDFNHTIWLHVFNFILCVLKNRLAVKQILASTNHPRAAILLFPPSPTPKDVGFDPDVSIAQHVLADLARQQGRRIIPISSYLKPLYGWRETRKQWRISIRNYRLTRKCSSIPLDELDQHLPKSDMIILDAQAEAWFGLPESVFRSLESTCRVFYLNWFTPHPTPRRSLGFLSITLSRAQKRQVKNKTAHYANQYQTRLQALNTRVGSLLSPFHFQTRHWFETMLAQYFENEFKFLKILDLVQPRFTLTSINWVGYVTQFNRMCGDRRIHRIGMNHGCVAHPWPEGFPAVDEILAWSQDDVEGMVTPKAKSIIGNPDWTARFQAGAPTWNARDIIVATVHNEIDSFPISFDLNGFERTLKYLVPFCRRHGKRLIIKSHPRFDLHRFYDHLAGKYSDTVRHIYRGTDFESLVKTAFCVIHPSTSSTVLYTSMVYQTPVLHLDYLLPPGRGGILEPLPLRFGVAIHSIPDCLDQLARLFSDPSQYQQVITSQNQYLTTRGFFNNGTTLFENRIRELLKHKIPVNEPRFMTDSKNGGGI